jgi:hypothetical protein
MRLFQRRGEENPPKSLKEIQSSLNYYASVNGDTTTQVDRLRDQLDQLGYQAEYQCGENAYEIKPLTYYTDCSFCSGKCAGH